MTSSTQLREHGLIGHHFFSVRWQLQLEMLSIALK